MEKKEFLDVNREYFKSIGFQILKKGKFYFDSEDITLRVWIMHSNFSETYYIDYDVRFKALHPELQTGLNDNIWDSIIAGRLNYNEKKEFTIEYSLWEKELYLKDLKTLSEKQICPIILGGIDYIKKGIRNNKILGGMVFLEDIKKKIMSL